MEKNLKLPSNFRKNLRDWDKHRSACKRSQVFYNNSLELSFLKKTTKSFKNLF